jgi:hypothetical protein
MDWVTDIPVLEEVSQSFMPPFSVLFTLDVLRADDISDTLMEELQTTFC